MTEKTSNFIWDPKKELLNIHKHGVDFMAAVEAFKYPKRKIFVGSKHNKKKPRLFCLGEVRGKVLTVRFTYRDSKIRIFGAGYWRKGVKCYEEN